MPLTLRPSTPEDVSEATPLLLSAGPEVFRFFFHDDSTDNVHLLEQLFVLSDVMFSWKSTWVAELDGEVVGVLHCVDKDEKERYLRGMNRILPGKFGFWNILRRLHRYIRTYDLLLPIANNELYVEQIAIDERFRGRGLGEALLRHACEIARARGLEWIVLDVEATNPRGHRFYRRLGFEDVAFKTSRLMEKTIYFEGFSRVRCHIDKLGS